MAPEACDPDVDEYSGKATDVWALGITLYTMLFNKCPFWGQTDYQLMECIRNNDIVIPQERTVSEGMTQILMAMLAKDPAARITLPDLLANPWLNGQ